MWNTGLTANSHSSTKQSLREEIKKSEEIGRIENTLNKYLKCSKFFAEMELELVDCYKSVS